jgi:hypothetical protein
MNYNYKQFKMKKKMPDLQSKVTSNNDYRDEVKRVKAKMTIHTSFNSIPHGSFRER